jgi:excisionase family DNA binding protein
MNVHTNTVLKLIDAGTLPAAKIGRAYVLLLADVMKYVERMVLDQTSQRRMGGPLHAVNGSPHLLRKRGATQISVTQ